MKITNCTRILLALCSIGGSIPQMTANTTDASSTAHSVEFVADANPAGTDNNQLDTLENLLKGVLKQLKSIDLTLEELALIVENNTLRTTNKREMIDSLRQMRDLIEQISNDAFVKVNEPSLKLLLIITESLASHLQKALNAGFSNLPIYDWEQSLKRSVEPEDLTLEKLGEHLERNESAVIALGQSSRTAGLRWYNRAYRSVDANLIQPCNKYHIGSYAMWGGLATSCAFLLWWQSDSKNPWLRNKFGWAPKYTKLGELNDDWHEGTLNREGERVGEPHPIKNIGKANVFVREHITNVLPVNSWVFTAFMAATIPQLGVFQHYVGKKITNLTNFLKGGSYANKTVQDINKVIPKATLKDLVGLDHVKDTFSLIVKYVEDPERFDRTKLSPEKGFLLTGPARTGKTYSAEALAGEIREMYKRNGKDPDDFNFIVLNASFIEQEGLRRIISAARTMAPCILFIDEIDLLGLQRAGNNPKMLHEFLTTMSGCLEDNDPTKPVIMIAATNRPENLDEALRQRGRFGKEIRFEYPSAQYRREYLVKKMNSLSINLESFDLDQLVRETEGRSYEELNAMLRSAFLKAKVKGEILTQDDVDQALDQEVRHIISSNVKELSAHEKEIVAINQAGRALAVMLLDGRDRLAKVTIRPYLTQLREETVWEQYWHTEDSKQKKISYGKTFTYHDQDSCNFDTRIDKMHKCMILLAGHAAEKVLLGSSGYSYHTEDAHHAFEIAKSMALEGIDITNFTNELKTKYFEQALGLRKQYEQEVTALLELHKDKLKAVADALTAQETLSCDEVEAILFPEKAAAKKAEKAKAAAAAKEKEILAFEEMVAAPAA